MTFCVVLGLACDSEGMDAMTQQYAAQHHRALQHGLGPTLLEAWGP